jgi:hypothetical protein
MGQISVKTDAPKGSNLSGNQHFTLPSIEIPTQRAMVERIITEFSKKADLDATALIKTDLPERLARAANYQFARICEVMITAIQEAVLAGEKELKRKHFALAYVEHSDARGRNGMNPFISPDWKGLKPGYFILKPKKKQDEVDEYEGDS